MLTKETIERVLLIRNKLIEDLIVTMPSDELYRKAVNKDRVSWARANEIIEREQIKGIM